MRIISGKYKGRIITPPANLRARPTTDFAKENLFNVLNNLIDYEDCDVLDLFAGTGSISYEFASRGARSVTAVEVNSVHYNFIRETLRKLDMKNVYPVRANSFLYIKGAKKTFDVVFADPPYDIEGSEELPEMIFSKGLLNKEGHFILEHSKNLEFRDQPYFYETRNYGSVHFSIFKNS